MIRILQRLFSPGAMCLWLCAIYMMAGLWPFNFFPKNQVDFTKEPPGLRFRGGSKGATHHSSGLAFTPRPLGSSSKTGSATIRIRLRCNREPRFSVPGILVLCDREKKPFLFLGQWKSALIVRRFKIGDEEGRRWKEASISNALNAGAIRTLTVTSNEAECILYVDGVAVKRYPRFSLVPESGSLQGYYLVLGNTPEATRGWAGDILSVALYDRSLSQDEVEAEDRSWAYGGNVSSIRREGLFLWYDFQMEPEGKVTDHSGKGNDLLIPPRPRFATRLLTPVEIDVVGKRSFIQDVLLNVVGFMPFGLFFSAFLAGRTRLGVPMVLLSGTLGGTAISLIIELAQSQIPVRISSAADLVSNTLGAGLGALFFALLLARKRNLTGG